MFGECDVCGKVGVSKPFEGIPYREAEVINLRLEDGAPAFNLGHDEVIYSNNDAADSILER